MNSFQILKQEIIECRIRAKSDETVKVLNYLQEFAENNLNNGWISVDNMLPKEFETVLLFGKKYNGEPLITSGHLVQSLVDEFGIEEGFSVPIFITHWQPLPQPPKE